MEYLRDIAVRFADIDPAGVVYYPTYLHYCHSAFEDFFGDCHGTPYPEWLTTRRLGFPTRHLEADYARPVRYGEPLQIAITVPRLGERSLDFRFEARVAGEVRVWALATKVCIDLDSFAPRPVPDDLRTVARRYGATESS